MTLIVLGTFVLFAVTTMLFVAFWVEDNDNA